MKTFKNVSAQGDVYIRRVGGLPKNVVRVPEDKNKVVVAHSETGHNHVMNGGAVEMYRPETHFDFDSWLVVKEPTTLDHQREFDTHESILFEPGIYRVRRQREYTPEGFRRVED